MAAYISSIEPNDVFLRSAASMSVPSTSLIGMPRCLSSASNEMRPLMMFSSRRSFLNHWRILERASLLLAIFIQSRLGPLSAGPRMTSMISPVDTMWSMGTMRLFTLQPTMRLPTAEWIA